MRVKKGKKATKSTAKGNLLKNSKKQPAQWQKVKLTGNLLSDDGGCGLEGLLGLEVLENPQKAIHVTREKRIKIKEIKVPMAEDNSDESESERSGKNQRKKKKKLLKKAKEKAAAKKKNNEPGKFVRPLPMDDDVDVSNAVKNDDTDKKKKKKSKKTKQPKVNDDTKSNEALLSIDDLVVSIFCSVFCIKIRLKFIYK